MSGSRYFFAGFWRRFGEIWFDFAMKTRFVVFLLLGMLSACAPGPCEELRCLEADACASGDCGCAQGFAGANCEWREIDKFLGEYRSGTYVCGGRELPYSVHTLMGSKQGNRFLEIRDGVHGKPLLAEVDGWNFRIAPQDNFLLEPPAGDAGAVVVSGEGWLEAESGALFLYLSNYGCTVEMAL